MLFAFTPGIALATIETTRLPDQLRARRSRLPATLLLGAGIAILAAYTVRGQTVTPQFIDALGALLAGLGTGLIVAAVLVLEWSTDRCWWILDNRVIHWIGERSYSLYLVHQPVIVAIVFNWAMPSHAPAAQFALLLPIALGISLLFAAMTYRYVERPCLRLRSRAPGRRLRNSLALPEVGPSTPRAPETDVHVAVPIAPLDFQPFLNRGDRI
jgi:peptidoglycan/LPS O-acetylase OafA/YrhL